MEESESPEKLETEPEDEGPFIKIEIDENDIFEAHQETMVGDHQDMEITLDEVIMDTVEKVPSAYVPYAI